MAMMDVPRCQHIKVDGVQCGSPSLRRKRFCFFHKRLRDRHARVQRIRSTVSLPMVEDANSLHLALMDVLQNIATGRLEPKRGGLMLYGLQIVSTNLKRVNFEPQRADDVVIDRHTVDQTCIGGPQWIEEEFGEEAEPAYKMEPSREGNADGNITIHASIPQLQAVPAHVAAPAATVAPPSRRLSWRRPAATRESATLSQSRQRAGTAKMSTRPILAQAAPETPSKRPVPSVRAASPKPPSQNSQSKINGRTNGRTIWAQASTDPAAKACPEPAEGRRKNAAHACPEPGRRSVSRGIESKKLISPGAAEGAFSPRPVSQLAPSNGKPPHSSARAILTA